MASVTGQFFFIGIRFLLLDSFWHFRHNMTLHGFQIISLSFVTVNNFFFFFYIYSSYITSLLYHILIETLES